LPVTESVAQTVSEAKHVDVNTD